METYKFYCLVLVVSHMVSFHHVEGYVCSTPDEWLAIFSGPVSALYLRHGEKWPGGVVKYHLHSSLEEQDIKQVYLAIEEFHKKTCIRFEPYKNGDPNYIGIELDPNMAGAVGTVCMRGGYQYVRFGRCCRKMDAIIHELGHNLCLGHEHQRYDRDKYINYSGCTNISSETTSIGTFQQVRGMYDYASQMHYQCGSCHHGGWSKSEFVTECGPQVTEGLSVLDADHINAMYNCKGCFRHRWVPVSTFKIRNHPSFQELFFALGDHKTQTIPCRAFFKRELVVGQLSYHRNQYCVFSHGEMEHRVSSGFELFTIPDGNRNGEYYLAKVDDGCLDSVNENGVVAGRLLQNYRSEYGEQFVAYVNLTNVYSSCDLMQNSNETSMMAIGKVSRRDNGIQYAYFSFCGKEFKILNYYVLACRNIRIKDSDTSTYVDHDVYTNWKLRKMYTLKERMSLGSNVTIYGYVPPDAQTFFIDFTEQTAGGNITLHLNAIFGNTAGEELVTCSSLIPDKWQHVVEMKYFRFWRDEHFKLEIICGRDRPELNLFVNGEMLGSYSYKLPLENVQFIRVHGDIRVVDIKAEISDGINSPNSIMGSSPKLTSVTYENTTESGKIMTNSYIGGRSEINLENNPNVDPMSEVSAAEHATHKTVNDNMSNICSTTKSSTPLSYQKQITLFIVGIISGLSIFSLLGLIAVIKFICLYVESKMNNDFSNIPVVYEVKRDNPQVQSF